MKKYFIILLHTILIALNVLAQEKLELSNEQLFDKKTSSILFNKFPSNPEWLSNERLLLNYWNREKNKYEHQVFNITNKSFEAEPHKPVENISSKGLTITLPNNKIIQIKDSLMGEPLNITFSPDEKFLAYTRKNNLFVYNLITNIETAVTKHINPLILTGYASWIYYEEILGRSSKYKAFWWSPDSKNLCFMQFDDTEVPLYPIYRSEGQHGSLLETRYPQPGDNNPTVKIGFVDINNLKQIVWTPISEKKDGYFAEPVWNSVNQHSWVTWQNRLQNSIIVYDVNPKNGDMKVVYEEQQPTWIDIENKTLHKFYFLKNKDEVILTSDKSGWMSLYKYVISTKEFFPITQGFSVTEIIKIDETNHLIYFVARKNNSARYNLYSIDMNGSALKAITDENFHHKSIVANSNADLFYVTEEKSASPTVAKIIDRSGKLVSEIAQLSSAQFNNYKLCTSQIILIKSADGLFDLPCYITLPTQYDPNKKYPLLVSIYGGPDAGTVRDSWEWNDVKQLYANEGIIQVKLDHRASGHFGKTGLNYLYKRLGYWEIEDYKQMVKYLIENYHADPLKVCITGFSYGGYMTCLALTKAADIFTHGMAGGSVIDWTLYDSDYTERYMQTPKLNPEGYKEGSVLTYIQNFKGKLQLVHGTDDDNVHIQNSLQFLDALENNLKLNVEFMAYPGGKHGWGGAKWKHFNLSKHQFVYQNLLNKDLPNFLLKN